MKTTMDFEEYTVNKEKRQRKIESKKRDKSKNTTQRKKHVVKDNRNSSFRNNYKNYQYDYEEDFYEPY